MPQVADRGGRPGDLSGGDFVGVDVPAVHVLMLCLERQAPIHAL